MTNEGSRPSRRLSAASRAVCASCSRASSRCCSTRFSLAAASSRSVRSRARSVLAPPPQRVVDGGPPAIGLAERRRAQAPEHGAAEHRLVAAALPSVQGGRELGLHQAAQPRLLRLRLRQLLLRRPLLALHIVHNTHPFLHASYIHTLHTHFQTHGARAIFGDVQRVSTL